MYEWRIRETSFGDFMAEYGSRHEGGMLSHNGIGYTMPAFIVTEAARFDTRQQAERYIERMKEASQC